MKDITERFVDSIYDFSSREFPENIYEKAQNCLLDYLAVTLGGSIKNESINIEFIESNIVTGKSHIIGSDETAGLTTAVMINAFNAHCLELDDSHRVAMTHVGAPLFSALLGVAENYECTIREVLKAAIVGYEVSIRLGKTIQPGHKKRGFHVTGTCCCIGTAMAIASMLHYSKEEMENVLSASATAASGLLGIISGASEQKPYTVANAAVAAVNSALYGKYFRGAENILGGKRGFFKCMCDDIYEENLFSDGYEIEGIYQKLYAACRHCHAPMEAMLLMMEENDIKPSNIKSISIRTYDLAIEGHNHTKIEGISSAKQSIPYGVAAACIFRKCDMSVFSERHVNDNDIKNLLSKIQITADEELSNLVPAIRAAIVETALNDGQIYIKRIDFPKGEPENPITREELIDKFISLADCADIDDEKSEQIIKIVFKGNQEKVELLLNKVCE